jgi:hypothetical protein
MIQLHWIPSDNIDYDSRTLLIHKNRDVNGRFCLSINSFGAERVKDNKFRRSIAQLPSTHHEFHESKTIEKIKINPLTSKNQNLSEKSYEEKLRRIMINFTNIYQLDIIYMLVLPNKF